MRLLRQRYADQLFYPKTTLHFWHFSAKLQTLAEIFVQTLLKNSRDTKDMPENVDDNEEELPNWIFDVPEVPASQLKIDKNENILKFTEPLVVKRVYHLGRILSQVFDYFQLHYWTSGKCSAFGY